MTQAPVTIAGERVTLRPLRPEEDRPEGRAPRSRLRLAGELEDSGRTWPLYVIER